MRELSNFFSNIKYNDGKQDLFILHKSIYLTNLNLLKSRQEIGGT